MRLSAVTLAAIAPLLASCNVTENGRYQLVVSHTNSTIYRIDTRTGEIVSHHFMSNDGKPEIVIQAPPR